MTGQPRGQGGWRDAFGELAVAAVLVAGAAAAGYLLAGPAAVTIVMVVAAAGALLVVRSLLPPPPPPAEVNGGTDYVGAGVSFYGYWSSLADLRNGMAARASYDMRLRRTLEHLLAARLAERHGVNLYTEPSIARRLLFPGGRDDDLWAWIDPREADRFAGDAPRGTPQPPGIPRRVLERLINRLEQL